MMKTHLVFRLHALLRMRERAISVDEVSHAIRTGKEIENYPEDTPYPSRLVLGWTGARPLHIVVADNIKDREIIVITVYEPESKRWLPGFSRRKK